MEIIKSATDWAKAEVFSSTFFIVFGVVFLVASIGFWQLGKTDIAKAYIIPTLVAGVLLMIIGIGLVYTNKTRLNEFERDYKNDKLAFVQSEIARADATLKEYQTIVFKAIPVIMIICSLLIIFMNKPIWRASAITTIAMMAVILLIDGTAHGRIDVYNQELLVVEKELSNS